MMHRAMFKKDNPVNSSDEVVDGSNEDGLPTMNEQSNMSGTKITEEEIDAIDDITTAIKTCKMHKVVFSNLKLTDVSSLRLLLKRSLLCDGSTRVDIEDTLQKRQHIERPRLDNLYTLYREAYQLITENDKVLLDVCNKNIKTDFINFMEILQNYTSPILIIGETGAGKTSFINLLLGERLLPTSLLSNTHTICELRYSHTGNLEAEVEYIGHTTGTDVKKFSFKDNQHDFVRFIKAEAENKNVRKITVHGPFNILKNDIVIVDSPGAGESTEMTDVVLGYVGKAAAFVYVIDLTNAGGVQQRVQEFIENVKEITKGIYDEKVKNAMFVCNKLDEVPIKEKDVVIKDTVERLHQLWKELASDQIIPFSTSEAQWIQDQGAVAPNFRKVLDKLSALIPAAQFVTTLKAQRWLGHVLEECLYITGTHMHNSRLSENQILVQKTMAEQRLVDLDKNLESFISQQKENVAMRIQKGAAEMYERVNTEQTQANVCSFDESALPTDRTWHEAAANIRTQLFEKVLKAMNLQQFAEHIECKIKEDLASKIPSFQSSLKALRVTLCGRNETGIEEKTTTFLPEYVRRVYGESIGMTVFLTLAIPFIALGRFPLFLVQRFKESRQMLGMRSEYETANGRKKQIKEVCEKYANYVFQHVVQKIEIQALATEAMQVCYSRIDELENEMKEQIDSDRTFIGCFTEGHRAIRSGMVKIKKIDDKLKCLKTKVDNCLNGGVEQ